MGAQTISCAPIWIRLQTPYKGKNLSKNVLSLYQTRQMQPSKWLFMTWLSQQKKDIQFTVKALLSIGRQA